MAVAAFVRKSLSAFEIERLRRRGFTVTATAITGGTDALLRRSVVGGAAKLRLLKRRGIRT